MVIGAQLYTVRNFAKDLPSFEDTLKRIADIGYTTVQVSGTCDYPALWLKDALERNGLRCVLTHVKPDRLITDTNGVCEDHRTFGCGNIGIGSSGVKNLDDEAYRAFKARFLPVAKKIRENGLSFFFHNHVSEFFRSSCGKTFMELMAEDFSPEELQFTLDTYWAQYAGVDPNEWLLRLAGRVECIHLKDMAIAREDWGHRMAPVGSGNMNFARIIDTAAQCGVRYLLVEQDDCYGEDPFLCLKKSYDYLKSLGLN